MTPNQAILVLASALLVASANAQSAYAATVTETTTANIQFFDAGTATFSFPDLANADELVSISGGSVFNDEGRQHVHPHVGLHPTATTSSFSSTLTKNLTSA